MDNCFHQATQRTLNKLKNTKRPLEPSRATSTRTRRRRTSPPEKKPSAAMNRRSPSHTGFCWSRGVRSHRRNAHSTGDTPQLLQVLDPTSPSTTTIEGRPSRNPPPNSHTTRIRRCILEAKEGQQPPHQIGRETHRPQASKQISTTSPMKLEQSNTGARKRPGNLIPLRRRRHRLVDAARKAKPPRNTPSANPSSASDDRRRAPPRNGTTTYPIYIRTAIPRSHSHSDASPARVR